VVAAFDGGTTPQTLAGCCSARPIGRSVWSGGSPPASPMVASKRRSSTRSSAWWRSGCSASRLGEPALGPAKPDPGEDLVDHDQLRHDPVLATLAGKLEARRTDCAPLAGKSTLNRLEHAPSEPSRYHKIGHDGAAIERLFVDFFLEAHQTPPGQIVRDLDATDDPLHGHQEGRFFHGYGACPPAAQGPTGGIVTATCRCMCSAAGPCSQPSSGARTSMRQPVPWPRSNALLPRSGRAGHG
jgi:hypothetical protein